MLNLPLFRDVDPAVAAAPRRSSGFDEVVAGLTEPEARHEAHRCLSCGNCFECDNCFAACPEQAIMKLAARATASTPRSAPAARTCFEQCPCHAIEMVAEPAAGVVA